MISCILIRSLKLLKSPWRWDLSASTTSSPTLLAGSLRKISKAWHLLGRTPTLVTTPAAVVPHPWMVFQQVHLLNQSLKEKLRQQSVQASKPKHYLPGNILSKVPHHDNNLPKLLVHQQMWAMSPVETGSWTDSHHWEGTVVLPQVNVQRILGRPKDCQPMTTSHTHQALEVFPV